MSKLGTKSKPAIVRVQTEERATELYTLCDEKGWIVIISIEPDNTENIDDIKKLQGGSKSLLVFKAVPSRNAPCPCGSGKQYKRCHGK